MSAFIFSALANHLWQSTLFASAVWLLTVLLRNNRAAVRHWLWVAASVKFLIPFAVLVMVGRNFGSHTATSTEQSELAQFIGTLSQPFSHSTVAIAASPAAAQTGWSVLPMVILTVWLGGALLHLLAWWARWRRIALIRRNAVPVDGRELTILRRLENRHTARRNVAIAMSDTSLEPGVVGIFAPTLIWPRQISDFLSDSQLETVIAHELCHVRRQDNLTMAIHLTVEVLFWFHPLVWWVERQLVEERERACDEEVVRGGCEPQMYAESIVKTCEFCANEAPVCIAGVTGSSLRERVEAIMGGRVGQELTLGKRILLMTVGIVSMCGPDVSPLHWLHSTPHHQQNPQAADGGRIAWREHH